jgi:hypothetical protein
LPSFYFGKNGRESKIEIRDLIVEDFRFGLFSIIDFRNHGIPI